MDPYKAIGESNSYSKTSKLYRRYGSLPIVFFCEKNRANKKYVINRLWVCSRRNCAMSIYQCKRVGMLWDTKQHLCLWKSEIQCNRLWSIWLGVMVRFEFFFPCAGLFIGFIIQFSITLIQCIACILLIIWIFLIFRIFRISPKIKCIFPYAYIVSEPWRCLRNIWKKWKVCVLLCTSAPQVLVT